MNACNHSQFHLPSPPPVSRRDFLGRAMWLGTGTCAVSALGKMTGLAAEELLIRQDSKLVMTKPWQIGCYTRPWDQYEYTVALDAIAEAGFQYAGLMTTKSKTNLVISVSTTIEEARDIGEEVAKRGLKLLSVYGGDFQVAKSLEAGLEGLKKLIDNCVACGAPNLLLGGTGEAKLQERYYRAVAECCPYAAAKGLCLSVKPHGGLNATGPQCRQLIERVARKNFGLWYDPGNIYFYSDGTLDPVQDAAAVDGLVVGMSVKDFQPPKEVQVTPGAGKVDFARVMAVLKKGGFINGPLVIECLARGDRPKLLSEAKKARQFVERIVG